MPPRSSAEGLPNPNYSDLDSRSFGFDAARQPLARPRPTCRYSAAVVWAGWGAGRASVGPTRISCDGGSGRVTRTSQGKRAPALVPRPAPAGLDYFRRPCWRNCLEPVGYCVQPSYPRLGDRIGRYRRLPRTTGLRPSHPRTTSGGGAAPLGSGTRAAWLHAIPNSENRCGGSPLLPACWALRNRTGPLGLVVLKAGPRIAPTIALAFTGRLEWSPSATRWWLECQPR